MMNELVHLLPVPLPTDLQHLRLVHLLMKFH